MTTTRNSRMSLCAFLWLILLTACGGNNTESYVDSPGEEKTGKTKALETGANLLQDKTPLNAISMYLNGFHFYNGQPNAQMEAHHYCTKLNEDITQCIIFDGNGEDAKIMGVEYIISRKLFASLPDDEKKLWHSHRYEVKSGLLIAPAIPDTVEYELMEEIVSTYGKTFHTWHTDQDLKLPQGYPQIMMGISQEGIMHDSLVQARDERFDISTKEKHESRQNLPELPIIEGADSWEDGRIWQLHLREGANTEHHQ